MWTPWPQPTQPINQRELRDVWHLFGYGRSVDPAITTDPDVQSFESDRDLGVSELSGTTQGTLLQSSGSVLDQLPGRAVVRILGLTSRITMYPNRPPR